MNCAVDEDIYLLFFFLWSCRDCHLCLGCLFSRMKVEVYVCVCGSWKNPYIGQTNSPIPQVTHRGASVSPVPSYLNCCIWSILNMHTNKNIFLGFGFSCSSVSTHYSPINTPFTVFLYSLAVWHPQSTNWFCLPHNFTHPTPTLPRVPWKQTGETTSLPVRGFLPHTVSLWNFFVWFLLNSWWIKFSHLKDPFYIPGNSHPWLCHSLQIFYFSFLGFFEHLALFKEQFFHLLSLHPVVCLVITLIPPGSLKCLLTRDGN